MDDTVLHTRQGHSYIIPDHLATSFQNTPSEMCTITPFENEKELKEKTNYTGKRLLINRTGGIGDFFFICRTVHEIKKQYKNVFAEFTCAPRYQNAITSLLMPHIIDKSNTILIPYPSYEMCDYFFTFEGFLEDTREASRVNAFDLVGRDKFFIDVGMNHTTPVNIPPVADEQAQELLKGITQPMVGIQIKATAILRTYPTHQLLDLMHLLIEKGYKVVLIDKKPNIEALIQGGLRKEGLLDKVILPYSDTIAGSLEVSAALIKHCHLLIAPDSSLVYIGDSLGTPTISLYGPVSSYLRAKGLNVYAIEAKGGCYNCYRHGSSGCPWSNDGWSCCLKKIRPDTIFNLAVDIIDGKK
jgi:ADP-heptose:LPS heptosyltransferase